MLNKVKILVVGDIIGKGARNAFISYLPTLKEKYQYDIIAVNAENTTHGNGLSHKHYDSYKRVGINVLTMGNHTLGVKDIIDYIDKTDSLIVPANVDYKNEVFDKHKELCIDYKGYSIKFVNLLGSHCRINGLEQQNAIAYFEEKYSNDDSILIVDFHGEYTLDKNLFAYYFDGKIAAIYGTHTHVQTADERLLPNGTAYISDVGMVGSKDSIIGYDYKEYIEKLKNGNKLSSPSKLTPIMINAVLFEIDLDSKKAISITRINETI